MNGPAWAGRLNLPTARGFSARALAREENDQKPFQCVENGPGSAAMGNTLSCFEVGLWDAHPEIKAEYPTPQPTGKAMDDMSAPLSHYFISSGARDRSDGGQTATIWVCWTFGS